MRNIEHDKEWYDKRIDYLSTFMTAERFATLRDAAMQRTEYVTLCVENTFHSQNASALVRSCEAFGVGVIHSVENLCKFTPNENIVKGSDKWVDINHHGNAVELIAQLRADGYRIVATSPHLDDRTPESFDVEAGPFALFFGTERQGISEDVMNEADEFVRIPMCGMVESLNVSASASILLYNLTTRLKSSDAVWQLEPLRLSELTYRWLMQSVKDSENILKRMP
ncbi:MAG: RNA methyltransferase [Rikenellaceae bacterium]